MSPAFTKNELVTAGEQTRFVNNRFPGTGRLSAAAATRLKLDAPLATGPIGFRNVLVNSKVTCLSRANSSAFVDLLTLPS